jgi:hypothetical protein
MPLSVSPYKFSNICDSVVVAVLPFQCLPISVQTFLSSSCSCAAVVCISSLHCVAQMHLCIYYLSVHTFLNQITIKAPSPPPPPPPLVSLLLAKGLLNSCLFSNIAAVLPSTLSLYDFIPQICGTCSCADIVRSPCTISNKKTKKNQLALYLIT